MNSEMGLGMMAETERPPRTQAGTDSRHRAREAALQMLYQWEVGRTPIDEVCRTFWTGGPAGTAPPENIRLFALLLASGVAANTTELDSLIVDAAEHWRLERMNVMDRLILRLGVYEFLYERETPAKVVINEALELGRTFSADDSVRFINGILDAIRRTLNRE
jgi:N utilization substance protein B